MTVKSKGARDAHSRDELKAVDSQLLLAAAAGAFSSYSTEAFQDAPGCTTT